MISRRAPVVCSEGDRFSCQCLSDGFSPSQAVCRNYKRLVYTVTGLPDWICKKTGNMVKEPRSYMTSEPKVGGLRVARRLAARPPKDAFTLIELLVVIAI